MMDTLQKRNGEEPSSSTFCGIPSSAKTIFKRPRQNHKSSSYICEKKRDVRRGEKNFDFRVAMYLTTISRRTKADRERSAIVALE